MAGEDPTQRIKREVREMLVIDRVELVLVEKLKEMRDLDRQQPRRREQLGDAGHEVIEVRHLGKRVVAHEQIGRSSITLQFPRELTAKEPGKRRNPCRL